jgi:hypothetical protein
VPPASSVTVCPIVPAPASVAPAFTKTPRASEPSTVNVPCSTVVAPVYVLFPLSVSTPAPVFFKFNGAMLLSLMTPAKALVVAPPIATVSVATFVGLPFSTMANDGPGAVVKPLTVTLWPYRPNVPLVPKATALGVVALRAPLSNSPTVPARIERSPVKLLLELRLRGPLPCLVKPPVPLSWPNSVVSLPPSIVSRFVPMFTGPLIMVRTSPRTPLLVQVCGAARLITTSSAVP